MKRSLAALAGALLVLVATEARADEGAWLWIENRVALNAKPGAEPGRVDLRIFGELQGSRSAKGPENVLLRMGPLFFLTDWLFIGTHGNALSVRAPDGTWRQQAWVDLEPDLFGRLGDFAILDRNRGEYRWRQDARDVWFYRNMLRISYAPERARWIPYIWDEVYLNASQGQFVENRASIGIGRMVGASTRIDVGYVFRSRRESAAARFDHDHVVTLFFFFDVPRPPPPPGEAPAALPAPGVPAPDTTWPELLPTTPPATPPPPPPPAEPPPAEPAPGESGGG